MQKYVMHEGMWCKVDWNFRFRHIRQLILRACGIMKIEVDTLTEEEMREFVNQLYDRRNLKFQSTLHHIPSCITYFCIHYSFQLCNTHELLQPNSH